MVAQSLSYSVLRAGCAADMKDFSSWTVNHVDTPEICRNQPLAGLWKQLERPRHKFGKQRAYGFCLTLHHSSAHARAASGEASVGMKSDALIMLMFPVVAPGLGARPGVTSGLAAAAA